MSVSSQDLPTADRSVGGPMTYCTPDIQIQTGCLSFEDYYPGTKYVDMMGLNMYNWGRGRGEHWSVWRTFPELMHDPKTNMYQRLLAFKKPIFLDEVGTTAVNFEGTWSDGRAREIYGTDMRSKNDWLTGFKSELLKNPQIVGALYFNRDKTNGFMHPMVGELDWSALSLRMEKEYPAVLDFWKDPWVDISVLTFREVSKNSTVAGGLVLAVPATSVPTTSVPTPIVLTSAAPTTVFDMPAVTGMVVRVPVSENLTVPNTQS